ncbi:MAG: DUF4404 family protein [Candidatus Eisenbacteria bacterium]
MSDPAITYLLKQLHRKLEISPEVNDADRALLRQLAADIDDVLREGKVPAAHQAPLLARVQDAVTRFEAEHPEITATLDGVSRVLSDMGI